MNLKKRKSMKKVLSALIVCLFVFGSQSVFSQASKGDLYISATGGPFFYLNSDANSATNLGDRLVMGLEGNYFVANGVSITGGLDANSAGNGYTAVAFCTRLYPGSGNIFIRHRAMVGLKNRYNSDFLLGVGGDFPLGDNFAFETNLDYLFVTKGIGIRLGIALTL